MLRLQRYKIFLIFAQIIVIFLFGDIAKRSRWILQIKNHAAPRAPHAPKIWDFLMTDPHVPATTAFDGTSLEVMCQGC